MSGVYVGLDVGSTTCHLTAKTQEGAIVRDQAVATSERNLQAVVRGLPRPCTVHLEASELAKWVRHVVQPHVTRVVVSHPRTNTWIAKDPRKSDRVDAGKLADLLRLGTVHEVYMTDDAQVEEFRAVVRHYDDLTTAEARLKVKIKARLRAEGVVVRGRQVFEVAGRDRALARVPASAVRLALQQLYSLLDVTVTHQGEARALLATEARRFPEIARFQTVPGVGLIGASRFVAFVQTPHRFATKRQLWRYSRLGVRVRQSDGQPLGPPRLDRTGNGRLKDLSRKAVLAAVRMRGENSIRRTYEGTLTRTHNATHARLTAQRKVLTILWTLWKEGTSYQNRRD